MLGSLNCCAGYEGRYDKPACLHGGVHTAVCVLGMPVLFCSGNKNRGNKIKGGITVIRRHCGKGGHHGKSIHMAGSV